MTFHKLVNRPDPPRSLASKISDGVELFGALKSAWDVGRSVVNAGRIVAPYVASGIAALV